MFKLNEIPKLKYPDGDNFFLIAGPCVIESRDLALSIAEKISNIADKYKVPYIFKGSYRKANRSRIDSFSGIGDEKALKILSEIGRTFAIPVITDIHATGEAPLAAEYVDVLQIPAFLCRQTDLLVAAAQTGKWVNVKKGQFVSPASMIFAINKIIESGNKNVMITDRGTMFGYQDIVVDYRGIVEMKNFGKPVVLDVTHSLQQPNQSSGITGGRPDLIETIASAGIISGVDGIFLETHPDPPNAKSDGANMLQLDKLDNLIYKLSRIRELVIELKGKTISGTGSF